MCLGLNNSEDGDYEDHLWLDDVDREKAVSEESIWSIELFGQLLRTPLYLAASSLPTLVQMLAQYELQREDALSRGTATTRR